MEKYRKLPTNYLCPKEDWFEVELPTGRTFKCIERRIVELSHIERHNTQGQIKNLSRALGTNKENFQAIANSIRVKGVLLTAQLPFLTVDNELLDGFTRFEAFNLIGSTHWVFNIVEPKEGFTLDDVREEVGLGANDHPPCKSATRDDFSKALARWIDRQDKTPTQGECIDWVDSIPHSFTSAVVANLVEKVIKATASKVSMESYAAPDIIKKVKEEWLGNVPKSTKVLAVNISGNDTYFKRVLCERAAALSSKKYDDTLVIGFTKDVPAEDVDDVRTEGLEAIQRINDQFETLFQLRMSKGDSFKFIDLDYIAPQKVGAEDELIVPVKS